MKLQQMEFSTSQISASLLVLAIFVTAASAQITMSRQWVRGQYPGDVDELTGMPLTGRLTRSTLPKRIRTKYIQPPVVSNSDYPRFQMSEQLLAKILRKLKEPLFASVLTSTAAAEGQHSGYEYTRSDETRNQNDIPQAIN